MSLLIWIRNKIYGKKDEPNRLTDQNPHVQPQITDAVTSENTTSEKVTESKPKRTVRKTAKKTSVSKNKY
jgi:hypothetical protein